MSTDDTHPDLRALRAQITALDHEVLGALNQRRRLVERVREHKQETGAPAIDAQREAELLHELADANPGPLSARAVHSVFTAVLDVMKQEVYAEPRAEVAARHATRPAAPASVAVIGTGLIGSSVGLAAKHAGVKRVVGWDADGATLADAVGSKAFDGATASLREAVTGAEVVVVAVPVGALVAVTTEVLAAAGPDTTVTDVGSTKRAVASGIDDSRFVPGHPLAGGATGGPARAAADLFDGATWFLTPLPATDRERLAAVTRFAELLGAHVVELDAGEHDRLLALTSHLPHALANALMRQIARAAVGHDEPLAHAGAALREMTRVAGANAAIWADIFDENGELIADAVAAHRDELADVERALRGHDRAFFESWITDAAAARSRMLEFAYRTEAQTLNRIRVRVPDQPGVLARITQTLGAARINIEDFELRHVSPEYGGVLVILVAGADNAERARALLRREGYSAA
jgi:prephenate dehydrogenase